MSYDYICSTGNMIQVVNRLMKIKGKMRGSGLVLSIKKLGKDGEVLGNTVLDGDCCDQLVDLIAESTKRTFELRHLLTKAELREIEQFLGVKNE